MRILDAWIKPQVQFLGFIVKFMSILFNDLLPVFREYFRTISPSMERILKRVVFVCSPEQNSGFSEPVMTNDPFWQAACQAILGFRGEN